MFYDVFDTVTATIACNGNSQWVWGQWEDGDNRDCTLGCRMRRKVTIPEQSLVKKRTCQPRGGFILITNK